MKTTLTVLLITNIYGLTSCAIKKHYFVNQTKSGWDAYNYCKTYYHNLSTFIDETEEQKFLQDAAVQTSHAWVGLYKGSGIWKWTTGEIATRISWDSGEPGNYDCAILHKDSKKLHDYDCGFFHTFFCMNVSEFVMIQQTESWEGALEYCRGHYDDLASLNSSRRMTDALSEITATRTQYVWIGLRFLAGEWFWISGDNPLRYQVWSSAGQAQCPAQNQRCAALDKNTKTWINRDCEEKLNFLCFAKPENL